MRFVPVPTVYDVLDGLGHEQPAPPSRNADPCREIALGPPPPPGVTVTATGNDTAETPSVSYAFAVNV
jgi:hypothetical protein